MTRVAVKCDRHEWLSTWFKRFLNVDKKTFKSMVAQGSVRVNKVMALEDVYLTPGTNVVSYSMPKVYSAYANVLPGKSHQFPSNPRWKVVRYISDYLMIIDKPAGLATMPSRDYARGCMTPYWLRKTVHREIGTGGILSTSRLDVGTHGLLVIGRDDDYVRRHNILIENRKISKRYTAVVMGWQKPMKRRRWVGSEEAGTITETEQWKSHLSSEYSLKDTTNASMEPGHSNQETPFRHLGLWNHFVPSRNGTYGNVPEPEFGGFSVLQGKLHDTDHLRVIASRIQTETHDVPVSLILEAVRPILPEPFVNSNTSSINLPYAVEKPSSSCGHVNDCINDSVALRPFDEKWKRKLIDVAHRYGDTLYEVDIELLTGKTHQIRTQLESEGLTIIGDWLYGSPYLPENNSFALCCRQLSWNCPINGHSVSYDLRNEDWFEASPGTPAAPVIPHSF